MATTEDQRLDYFNRFWPEFRRLGREHRRRTVITVSAAVLAAILQWLLLGSIPEGLLVRGVIMVGPHILILAFLLIQTLSDTAVTLDAQRGDEVTKLIEGVKDRDTVITALRETQAKPPQTPMQRERMKVLSELFDGCTEDGLKVLGLLAESPITVASFLASCDNPRGASEFMKRQYGPAMLKGVLGSVRDARGEASHFCVTEPWRPVVTEYVNDRLSQPAINSASDKT